MFERLKAFKHIGWDFDDTLVNHVASPLFWQFIRANPYNQQHSIVTMRSHGIENGMFSLLAWVGSGLDETYFAHVENVPDHLFESYHRSLDPRDHAYLLWKGETCKRIGADVLIDDMEAMGLSARGCDLYGIVHIHPDDFA